MRYLAIIPLVILLSVPIMLDGVGAEEISVEILDSDGNVVEGSIMNGVSVPFDTKSTPSGDEYIVRPDTVIPTNRDYYVQAKGDLDWIYTMAMKVEGMGWLEDAGLVCTISFGGKIIGQAAMDHDGRTVAFKTDGEETEIARFTMYRLDFRTLTGCVLDNRPERISGMDISFIVQAHTESHTVSFDPCGGTLHGEQSWEVLTGDLLGPLPYADRDGYRFGGWYWEGQTITSNTVMGDKDIEAKAQWIPLWIVYFDPNGGTCDESKRVVPDGRMIGILPQPVQEGHIFLDWYDAPEGGNEIRSTLIVSEDMTIYAQWVPAYDVEVIEESYVDEDGNNIYERITTYYYREGTIVQERYGTVTDQEGRLLSVSERTEITDPDGSVSLTFKETAIDYTERGRTVTVETNGSYPDRGFTKKEVQVYDLDDNIVSDTVEHSENGRDLRGNEYSKDSSSVTENGRIMAYKYGYKGTLSVDDISVKIHARYGIGDDLAEARLDSGTVSYMIADEIVGLMNDALSPLEKGPGPVLAIDRDTVSLSSDALKPLSDNGFTLSIIGTVGTVAIDPDCIEYAARSGLSMTLSIDKGNSENLNEAQLKTVGDGFAVVITMMYGDTLVHEIGGTASIELSPGLDSDRLRLWYVDDIGNTTEVPMSYDTETGIVSFSVDHFSVYLVTSDASFEMNPMIIAAVSIIFILIILLAIVLRSRRDKKEKA